LLDSKTCTTIANRIMRAAGLGSNLSAIPARNYEVLSDFAKTLALDPKAKVGNASGLPIPEAFRGLQQDYAYVGGGYDTPSERIQRALSDRRDSGSEISLFDRFTSTVPDRQYSFGDRFGNWGSTPAAVAPLVAPDRPGSLDNRFGNWGSAPADDAGGSHSRVRRALQNYKRTAAPGDLGTDSLQTVPTALPR
jgi:hypothetical protein